MKHLIYVIVLLIISFTAKAQSEEFVIDSNHSTIGFNISIAGGLTNVNGSFTEFEGTVEYDANDIKLSKFEITIYAGSINTGNETRDEHLRSSDFFEVETYPTITFQSTDVEEQNDKLVVTGDLEMHGIKKEIGIFFARTHKEPVVWIFEVPTIVFEGGLILNRKDYGIQANTRWNRVVASTGELAMSDNVEIILKVIAEGKSVAQQVVDAYQNEGVDSAISVYKELKRKYEGTEALSVNTLNQAGSFIYRTNPEHSIPIFQLNIEEYPKEAVPHHTIAQVYVGLEKKDEALQHLNKAIELDPGNEDVKNMLAQLKNQ